MSKETISLPSRFAVYGTVAGKPAVVARFPDPKGAEVVVLDERYEIAYEPTRVEV